MNIEIRKSPIHGLGVFAIKEINAHEVIEECPILILSNEELKIIDKTYLSNYYFLWENETGAIAWGNGSLYNHSYDPNAVYLKDIKSKKIIFKSLKTIKIGEEILVNYNGDPSIKNKVWFDKL